MRFNTINKHFVFLSILFLLGVSSVNKAQTVNDIIKDIDNERYKSAEKVAKDLIQKEPTNSDAYYYLGKLYLTTSNIDQAKQSFEKGLQIKKDDILNSVGMGAISLSKDDNQNAEKAFRNALDETDYDPNIAANIADMYLILHKKSLDAAKKIITDTRDYKKKDNKKSSILYLKLADLMYASNDNNGAMQNYQYSIDYDNKSVKGYVGIAKIYSRVKQYELAESNLKDAIKIDSTYAIAYQQLGELYYETKKYDDAVNNYKKYLSLTEPTNDNELRYASMLFLDKKYADAINTLKSIEANNSNNPTLYHIMAYSYYNLDDQNNGIATYDKFFAIAKPTDIEAYDYASYADMLSKTGKDSLAIISLHKAIGLDSTDSQIHLALANALYKTKKYADAANEFAKVNSLKKTQLNLRNYFDWGQAYLYSKQYVLADSTFKKMIDLKPDLPLGYLYRAIANASQDTTSELGLAKPYYEKFIEMASPTPDKYKTQLVQAYSYLGYYYFIKKDDPAFKTTWRENYKANWEKVLALDPENQQAKVAIENLKALK